MNDTPKIRFNEFTDEWEQRKLGDVTTRLVRKNQNLESTLPLTISSQYGLVDQITYFNNRVASRDVSNYYLVKNGEFAYNKSYSDGYPYGAVKRLDRYEMGVLSTLYIVFALKPDIINSDYLVSYYDTDNWYKQVAERAAEGARNHGLLNISADDFFDTELKFPKNLSEQSKIGAFFKHLDHLITLHQHKYEQMMNVKKTMLGRLFPYAGAENPQIRFGFSENWEEVKLGNIVSPYSDPVETPHGGYIRLGIRSHGKGTFHDYVQAGQELETAQMHRVAAHKFIVNITFGWEHAVAITSEQDAGKLVSHRFPQFSMTESIDDGFLKYVIIDERFKHHLFLSSPGGAGRNRVLNIPQMLEYKTRIPKIEEQRQIAGLLDSVNNLIDLYAEKVKKLKQIKSACLDKMFI